MKKVDLKTTPVHHTIKKTAKPQKNISDRAEKPPQKISESTLESVRTLADQGFLEKAYSLCEKLLKENLLITKKTGTSFPTKLSIFKSCC